MLIGQECGATTATLQTIDSAHVENAVHLRPSQKNNIPVTDADKGMTLR